MTPQPHDDEMLELATSYALGILTPEQAAAFEAHLREGCRTCRRELDTFATMVGSLGYAAPPARPRAEVRDRLLSRLQAEAVAASAVGGSAAVAPSGWTIVRSTEGAWEAADVNGMLLKLLFRDQTTGRFTALVRMEGGVYYPPHRHTDTEELYLLEGDLTVEGQMLRARDYCAATAGTVHGSTHSESGCTFLLATSEPEKLEARDAAGSLAGLVFVRASEGTWKGGPSEGVAIKPLFSDPARDTQTALVRMRPGARLPRHRHLTAEQFYMLEGDGHVADYVLRAGDFYQTVAGSIHDVTYTEGGCVFLLIASRAEILG
jgi:anti-sigma factor ChrR (cupin superfamily)